MTTFCDNDDQNLKTLHNDEAPSVHNDLCKGRSAWEIMREDVDFRNGALRKYIIGVLLKSAGPAVFDMNMLWCLASVPLPLCRYGPGLEDLSGQVADLMKNKK